VFDFMKRWIYCKAQENRASVTRNVGDSSGDSESETNDICTRETKHQYYENAARIIRRPVYASDE